MKKVLGCIVTGGETNNFLTFYKPENGKEMKKMSVKTGDNNFCLYYHPGRIIVGSKNGLKIYNIKDASIWKDFKVPTGGYGFHWTFDIVNPRLMVSVVGGTAITLWDISSRTKKRDELQRYTHTCHAVKGLRCRRNMICSGGTDGTIKFYDFVKKKEVNTVNAGTGEIWDFEEDRVHSTLFAGGYTNPHIKQFDLRKKGAIRKTVNLSGGVWSTEVFNDKNEVWFGQSDGNISAYDLRKFGKGNHKYKFNAHGTQYVYRLKRLGGKHKNFIATGSIDQKVMVFNIRNPKKPKKIFEKATGHYMYCLDYIGIKGNYGRSYFQTIKVDDMDFDFLENDLMTYQIDRNERMNDIFFRDPMDLKVEKKDKEEEIEGEGEENDEKITPEPHDLVVRFRNPKENVKFWRYNFLHVPSMYETIGKSLIDQVIVDKDLKLDSKTILKFIYYPNKHEIINETLDVPVDDVDRDEEFIPFEFGEEAELPEVDEKTEKREEEDGGEKEKKVSKRPRRFISFNRNDMKSFLDCYMMFRDLGMYGELFCLLEELKKIDNLKLLLLLFLKCIQKYEPTRIKVLFLDETEFIEENFVYDDGEEEEEFSEEFLNKLEKRLMEKKILELEKQRLKKKKEDEEEEEGEEDEEEEEKVGEVEKKKFKGAKAEKFNVDEFFDDKEGIDANEIYENIGFDTSFAITIFNIFKDKESEIRQDYNLISFFSRVLEQLEKFQVQMTDSHKDFLKFKMEVRVKENTRRGFFDFQKYVREGDFFSKFTNFDIYVPEKFGVHKEVLMMKSNFFYTILKDVKERELKIDLSSLKYPISELAFLILLRFIYFEKIDFNADNLIEYLKLVNFAHEYKEHLFMHALVRDIVKCFKFNKTNNVEEIISNNFKDEDLRRKVAFLIEDEGLFDEKEVNEESIDDGFKDVNVNDIKSVHNEKREKELNKALKLSFMSYNKEKKKELEKLNKEKTKLRKRQIKLKKELQKAKLKLKRKKKN